MVAVNVIAAPTDDEAIWLATSQEQQFLNVIRGRSGKLKPPVDNMDQLWSEQEKAVVRGNMLKCSAIGSPDTVRSKLSAILEETGADELIATAQVYDHKARLRSFELLADTMGQAQ